MSFYSELKRRNVLRAGAAYIVSAWLLIQVAETIFPLFGFDRTPARIVVIVLAIGFAPAMIVSWVFELTPEGWRKDVAVDRSLAIATQSARKMDRIIMLVLAMGLTYFAIDKFVLSESREILIIERAKEEALAEAQRILDANKSIAVLPFVDMSPGRNHGYFADGISEEILNVLAQLEGLNVTARTSSFQFRSAQDLKDVGMQLGVSYILEGSVRKDNDEVRITAQLIDSQTGFHLWSENYDNRLDGIFDIQEDIARAVAGALSIALNVEGRNELPGTGTDNLDAYDAFLEGNARLRSTDGWDLVPALYRRAVEIDPDYAEAWAALGAMIAIDSYQLPSEEARAAQERGRELVLRAIEIDPTYAEAYRMLSRFQWTRGDWIGATEWYEKYTEMAPADVVARLGSTSILARTGRLREAVRIGELRRQNDPVSFFGTHVRAERNIQVGRYDEARAALAEADRLKPPPEQSTDFRRLFLAISIGEAEGIRTALANYAIADRRAAPVVNAILEEFDSPRSVVLEEMRRIYDSDAEVTGEGRIVLASMAAHYGDPEFALQVMSDELSVNFIRTNRLWYPFFSEMRSLPGFKALAARVGFVEYWRKYGWADSCRPLRDDDFECE